jgi:hypothetical protein
MLEALKFVFSSFWTWAGTCLLLVLLSFTFLTFVAALSEAVRLRSMGKPPSKPSPPPFDN